MALGTGQVAARVSHIKGETVVVSAGFAKTHVTTAAAEASARGRLALCITGAYPTRPISRIADLLRLRTRGRVARLFERAESIPPGKVRAQLVPELLYDVARAMATAPILGRFHKAMCAATWRLYGRLAGGLLRQVPGSGLYHFRAGFGQYSVRRARQLGWRTLCDYALAHPRLVDHLVEHRGSLPGNGPHDRQGAPDPLGDRILADIDAADAVVVNSDFVKQTFIAVGWRPERIHVIYLGVDDNFLTSVPANHQPIEEGPLRILFAGFFERRKGAEELIECLSDLNVDWQLRLAGPVAPEIASIHAGFLGDDRVTTLGVLSRADLAREMSAAAVFVFPSRAEGSARVVFEALACGCYVVTTPNSGTIVEDGVHGRVVPPGDAAALHKALVDADADRTALAEVGSRNARVIRESFTQAAYGERLDRLYEKLLSAPRGSAGYS